MTTTRTLVVGSGHLAHRIATLAMSRDRDIVRLTRESIHAESGDESTFEAIVQSLRALDLTTVTVAYLVDDRDEVNLEFLIALLSVHQHLPVVASLFNENVAPHLQAANPNIRVLNPAKIAAPTFIDALDTPLTHTLSYVPARMASDRAPVEPDRLIVRLTIGFITMIVAATTYFHVFEELTWINAMYFVTVTVATVGYGDISLVDSDTRSKVVGIGLILGSTVFIWMIFSLTVDRIIKRRAQLALGRRTYAQRDHVIVCGLGRLGYFIAEQLLARGERVLIVECNEDVATIEHFRSRGADVYIGDARLPGVMHDVGVIHAKALYSVINNDFANLEIGLNARTFEPNLRLILRIFDDTMSERLTESLDIHLTYSMTAIAHRQIFDVLTVAP